MTDPPKPDDGNPLGDLLERARPDADFAAQQSMRALQSRLFGAAAQPVTMIGRWVIESRLGAGGGGTVYRARDPATSTLVAIKLLVSEGRGSGPRARLLREAQSLAKLQHPNIVEFHEVGVFDPSVIEPSGGSNDNGVFLAMEYVDGWNLAQWAEQSHPWQKIRDVFVAAGRGLAYAHERGFVHRDFKPSNVLVGKDGRVRVADFGLARATRELTAPLPGLALRLPDEPSLPGAHIALTKPGTVIGTPAFMAPEQHLSSRADPRSDQFSFCLALYEALYRRSPYVGATPGKILEAKLRGIILPPPRDTAVPSRVNRAIVRGLAPDPMSRHGSMEELLAALVADSGGPRPWRVAVAVGGVAVALGAVAAWKLWSQATQMPAATCGPELERAPWTGAVATDVAAAISGVGVAFGETTLVRVRERFEDFATAWRTARGTICGATPPAPAAMACLVSTADAATALIQALKSVDAAHLEPAIGAVASLPDPAACVGTTEGASIATDQRARLWAAAAGVALGDDHELTLMRAVLPTDGANAPIVAAVDVLSAETTRDRTAVDASAMARAHELLVAGDLVGLRDRAALAGLGGAVARGDAGAATAWMETIAAGSPALRARASTLLAEQAWRGDARDEVKRHCTDARSLGDTPDPDPLALFEVMRRCASLEAAMRDANAVATWETTAALAERAWGSDHPVAAGVRVELALANLASGRRDAARPHAALGFDVLRRVTPERDARRLVPLMLLAELEPSLESPGAKRWLAQAADVAGGTPAGATALTRATLTVADAVLREAPARARPLLERARTTATTADDAGLVGAVAARLAALPTGR